MARIRFTRDVRVDGVDVEAGVYDESNFPAGTVQSLKDAGWAESTTAPLTVSDEDEDADVKKPTKKSTTK